jgi:hypothetical protein
MPLAWSMVIVLPPREFVHGSGLNPAVHKAWYISGRQLGRNHLSSIMQGRAVGSVSHSSNSFKQRAVSSGHQSIICHRLYSLQKLKCSISPLHATCCNHEWTRRVSVSISGSIWKYKTKQVHEINKMILTVKFQLRNSTFNWSVHVAQLVMIPTSLSSYFKIEECQKKDQCRTCMYDYNTEYTYWP